MRPGADEIGVGAGAGEDARVLPERDDHALRPDVELRHACMPDHRVGRSRQAQLPAIVMRAMRTVGAAVAPSQSRSLPTASIVAQHRAEVAGDRDLLDRVRELAVLDPEPGGAARVVAGDGVEAHGRSAR